MQDQVLWHNPHHTTPTAHALSLWVDSSDTEFPRDTEMPQDSVPPHYEHNSHT